MRDRPEYLYAGVLSSQVAEYLRDMLDRYPCAVEVNGHPEHRDFQDLFAGHTHRVTGEDCMGQRTSSDRDGISWGHVTKNLRGTDDAAFYFFPEEANRAAFVNRFPDLVVNADPFTTKF
jgi:hypothetical protein